MIEVRQRKSNAYQIAAAVIGNALEWYDFVIFGFFAVVISRLFFPASDLHASLLLSTATFGVGFFMRPVGGILLGLYADRYGRKSALVVVLAIMTIGISMVAFAPTYAAVGVAAPILVVFARLLQGFATGGEFASATAYLIESASEGRRGLYGSWQMAGQGLAVLIGALVSAAVTRNLTSEELNSWGWRIPFTLGLIIGPIGIYIRRNLSESPAFLAARADVKFLALLRTHFRDVLVCMGITTNGTIAFYVLLLYMPTFATTQLGIPLDQAFMCQALGLCFFIVFVPIFGALSDRIGRRRQLMGACSLYMLLAYPLLAWVHSKPLLGNLVIVQIVFCTLLAAFFGPMSTAIGEQFPAAIRTTGMGTAYNLAVMIFGGFAQFFVTWLIGATGSPVAPAWYIVFGAAVGLVASCLLHEPQGTAPSSEVLSLSPGPGL